MTKHNLPHRQNRKNWTRDQQKKRVMELFYIRHMAGQFGGLTAQQIANRLEMISAQYVKDICREMTENGLLDEYTFCHRKRSDGSEITASMFNRQDTDKLKADYDAAQDSYLQDKMF